jgi:hypothetical protein
MVELPVAQRGVRRVLGLLCAEENLSSVGSGKQRKSDQTYLQAIYFQVT